MLRTLARVGCERLYANDECRGVVLVALCERLEADELSAEYGDALRELELFFLLTFIPEYLLLIFSSSFCSCSKKSDQLILLTINNKQIRLINMSSWFVNTEVRGHYSIKMIKN